jgi:hypothetical protein
VIDNEYIERVSLLAAKEIAESFNISMPRGYNYHNGILHTIRIIIAENMRGHHRTVAAMEKEGGEQWLSRNCVAELYTMPTTARSSLAENQKATKGAVTLGRN